MTSIYSLSHLSQGSKQDVMGPIQDDEALVLYAIVRALRIKTVLEIGGLSGYSAQNFLEAVGDNGRVFTCDINPMEKLANNHFFIHKDAAKVTKEDLHGLKIELLFFDCHLYDVQMGLLEVLERDEMIDNDLIIALHDTNTHPQQFVPWAYQVSQGWVHQKDERMMVNKLAGRGWQSICLHPSQDKHNSSFPYRHGLTIMKRFQPLDV
jgi:hypothetical protein